MLGRGETPENHKMLSSQMTSASSAVQLSGAQGTQRGGFAAPPLAPPRNLGGSAPGTALGPKGPWATRASWALRALLSFSCDGHNRGCPCALRVMGARESKRALGAPTAALALGPMLPSWAGALLRPGSLKWPRRVCQCPVILIRGGKNNVFGKEPLPAFGWTSSGGDGDEDDALHRGIQSVT